MYRRASVGRLTNRRVITLFVRVVHVLYVGGRWWWSLTTTTTAAFVVVYANGNGSLRGTTSPRSVRACRSSCPGPWRCVVHDHVRLNARRFRSVPVLLVLFGGGRPTVPGRRPVPVRVPLRRVRRRAVVVVVVVQSRRSPGGWPTVRRQHLDDGRRRETVAAAREHETVIISGPPVTE